MADTDARPADAGEVRGHVDPQFEKVAEVLAETASQRGEVGVGVAATIEGEVVLDLSWGDADAGPWTSDTLVCAYSCTKGLTALVAQMLYSRGLLDVDAPVGSYWPEYAVNGKEPTRVRHLLSHTAGVLTFPRYWDVIGPDSLGLADFDRMVQALAQVRPAWEPGAGAGYHALTYGWLVGEVIRRIDGRTPGRFFADEVAGPLGGIDAFIGLPEHLQSRVTSTLPLRAGDTAGKPSDPAVAEAQKVAEAALEKGREDLKAGRFDTIEALTLGSFFLHPDDPDINGYLARLMNEPTIRASELPAGNAIVTAVGLARAYVPLANRGAAPGGGPRLVTEEAIELFATPTATSTGTPTGFGLGYGVLAEGFAGPGLAGTAFGHGGAGGNMGLADPTRRISYAYVKNQMIQDPEVSMVPLRALYTCL